MLRGSNMGGHLIVYKKKSIQTVIHVLLSVEDLLFPFHFLQEPSKSQS